MNFMLILTGFEMLILCYTLHASVKFSNNYVVPLSLSLSPSMQVVNSSQ